MIRRFELKTGVWQDLSKLDRPGRFEIRVGRKDVVQESINSNLLIRFRTWCLTPVLVVE
jgi:hypothetical protein